MAPTSAAFATPLEMRPILANGDRRAKRLSTATTDTHTSAKFGDTAPITAAPTRTTMGAAQIAPNIFSRAIASLTKFRKSSCSAQTMCSELPGVSVSNGRGEPSGERIEEGSPGEVPIRASQVRTSHRSFTPVRATDPSCRQHRTRLRTAEVAIPGREAGGRPRSLTAPLR